MLHTGIPAKEIINGNVPALLNFDVNYNSTGIASGVKEYTILASTARPQLLEIWAEIITAFNAASTNVLTLGNSSTANEYLAAGDITEGTPGFYPASNAKKMFRITSDTGIWAKYTQTGSVAQVETAVIVEAVPGTLGAGTILLTFTSALTGVLNITANLTLNMTEAQVATAVRAALTANTTFATYFTAGGSGANVVMTAITAAANDSTLNLAYANGTCTGLTDDATSNNTTAGVAPATTGKAKFYLRITPLFQMT